MNGFILAFAIFVPAIAALAWYFGTRLLRAIVAVAGLFDSLRGK